jgi:hypothetical protein
MLALAHMVRIRDRYNVGSACLHQKEMEPRFWICLHGGSRDERVTTQRVRSNGPALHCCHFRMAILTLFGRAVQVRRRFGNELARRLPCLILLLSTAAHVDLYNSSRLSSTFAHSIFVSLSVFSPSSFPLRVRLSPDFKQAEQSRHESSSRGANRGNGI